MCPSFAQKTFRVGSAVSAIVYQAIAWLSQLQGHVVTQTGRGHSSYTVLPPPWTCTTARQLAIALLNSASGRTIHIPGPILANPLSASSVAGPEPCPASSIRPDPECRKLHIYSVSLEASLVDSEMPSTNRQLTDRSSLRPSSPPVAAER
jgi:hypothetical protein